MAGKLQPPSMGARPRKQMLSPTSACSTSVEPPQPSQPGAASPSPALAPGTAGGQSWGYPGHRPSGQGCPGHSPYGQCCPGLSEVPAPGWQSSSPQGSIPWEGVSQTSGFRETSNTPAGLAGIFIHLHVQIRSTSSLYKYMGAC